MADRSGVVLVVEDDPLLVRLICELLNLHGFKSMGAGTAEEALSIAAAEHPAVFLIDLALPGLSGVDLATRLRAREFHEAPMIAMSVSAEMVHNAGRSDAFQEILWKPFEITQLIRSIDESLARTRSGRCPD